MSNTLAEFKVGMKLSEPWLDDTVTIMKELGGHLRKTAEALEEARRLGVLEKYVVEGTKQDGTWSAPPPRRIP